MARRARDPARGPRRHRQARWFGSGPGSLIAVPDVATLTFADAQRPSSRMSRWSPSNRARTASTSCGRAGHRDRLPERFPRREGQRGEGPRLARARRSPGGSLMQHADRGRGPRHPGLERDLRLGSERPVLHGYRCRSVVVSMTLAPATAPSRSPAARAAHRPRATPHGYGCLGPVPTSRASEGKARSTLEGLGLVVADPARPRRATRSRRSHPDDRPRGRQLAPPGGTVTLVVSTGPRCSRFRSRRHDPG